MTKLVKILIIVKSSIFVSYQITCKAISFREKYEQNNEVTLAETISP